MNNRRLSTDWFSELQSLVIWKAYSRKFSLLLHLAGNLREYYYKLTNCREV